MYLDGCAGPLLPVRRDHGASDTTTRDRHAAHRARDTGSGRRRTTMTILSSLIGSDYRPAGSAAARALQDVVPDVHMPGSDRYAALTRTSNLTHAISPIAVVEARTPTDVSRTLRLAAAFGTPVAVQGTGHGATEEMRGAILVHTTAFDEVT